MRSLNTGLQNALQKFICEDISKEEYDLFVSMVQDKLQKLEVEKAEIKKLMAESHSSNKLTTIKNS
ncbi:hypothetical protein [Bacillus rubiinfantis]|uniref:hypothetical protein n=1 Tax=Bacillus rubiinfantis TaxID=1499680 RepID=UPI0005A65B3B|nr:hypothetical protein [Bacillus rubiinfantis]